MIGVGHNFYWIADPTGVIAFGSVFSTTQVWFILLLWRTGEHIVCSNVK